MSLPSHLYPQPKILQSRFDFRYLLVGGRLSPLHLIRFSQPFVLLASCPVIGKQAYIFYAGQRKDECGNFIDIIGIIINPRNKGKPNRNRASLLCFFLKAQFHLFHYP